MPPHTSSWSLLFIIQSARLFSGKTAKLKPAETGEDKTHSAGAPENQ